MNTLKEQIELHFKEKVTHSRAVTGGSIAQCQVVQFESGHRVFVKSYGPGETALLEAEVLGLKELAKVEAMSTPQILWQSTDWLALEYISSGSPSGQTWEDLAHGLFRIHQLECNEFGFTEDNFIGRTIQKNTHRTKNWADFFWQERLLFQWQLAIEKGQSDSALNIEMQRIEPVVKESLNSVEVRPVLLHGDLWAGNLLVEENGRPYLIDPAVYYGHFETDLAMMKLFGGFSEKFFSEYEKLNPLKPGHEKRELIYKLYHILNHLNLFGSTYLTQARQCAARL